MNNNLFSGLWIEKFRPQTLNDMILDPETKNYFKGLIMRGEIPHLLFIGSPGIGKTSLAKIIPKELDCSYRYINASDKRGIDDIRTEVIGFAQTKSFDGKMKIIILDECDGQTESGQRILRNVMEEYSDNVRFILTGNYKNRIIKPIISRCTVIELAPPINAISQRIIEIIQKEKIVIDDEQINKLKELIRGNYPDIRSIIKLLQRNVIDGVLKISSTTPISLGLAKKIFDKINSKTDINKIRQFIIENEIEFNNDYHDLMKSLFEVYYNSDTLNDEQKRLSLLIIGDHMYKHQFVMDFEINSFCCILQLMKV